MLKPRSNENREWQRVAVNMQARCRAVHGPARYDATLIIDMHHAGCCIEGTSYFSKGDVVRLVLELPFEGEISMTAEVAWSGPVNDKGDFRTGLRFVIDTPLAEETCFKLFHFCLLRQPRD